MPARLHHERVVHRDATPAHWLLLTHGIYGTGANWRGIARKLTEARPDWGCVLVDLRQHGRSEPGAPPHTIAACADDLGALMRELGDLDAIAGHSFGGKVALATRARAVVPIRQTWVLDASPSARPTALTEPGNTVLAVLDLLDWLPRQWAKREDFIAAVVEAGQEPAIAQWLAMNVVPDDAGGFMLRLDPGALRQMLADYYEQDLWASLVDPSRGEVDIMIADRSDTLSPEDRARLAQAPSHIHVHHIDAGHWLHIDAPATVVAVFAARL